MKNKIFIFILIILIIISFIFISKNMIKKSSNGNNTDSQDIVDYILNISSYSAIIEVQVNSNKNTNNYILLQEYNSEDGSMQEVIEPSNIAGIKIIKKDNNLSIENTNLNLSTIFENYQGLEDNSLDLYEFIQDYKQNIDSSFNEADNEVIMQTTENNSNKYIKKKELYIDKEKMIPTELIIKDDNQNTTIIIKYNKIELN